MVPSKETPTANQLPAHEAQTDATLLMWAHDFKGSAAAEKTFWHESAIFDNGDGSLSLYTHKQPISEAPQPGAIDTPTDEIGRGNELLLFDGAEKTERLMHGQLAPALRLLGFDAKADPDNSPTHKVYEVTFPSVDTANQRLDFIREQTGFAPADRRHHSEFYNAVEQSEALDEEVLLRSSAVDTDAHDETFHALAWKLLAKSTFNKIAERGHDLRMDIQSKIGGDPLESLNASRRLRNHMAEMEVNLNIDFVLDIEGSLKGDERALRLLKSSMFGLLFDHQNPPGASEVVEEEVIATLKRAQQLIDLGQSS